MALIKCPDCGKEVSDSAESCPGCARPIKAAKLGAAKGGSSGCGGCAGLAFLTAIGGLLFMGFCVTSISNNVERAKQATARASTQAPVVARPNSATPDKPGPTTPNPTDVRLWRANSKWDDSARAFIFKSALRSAGQRCDSVESQIMGSPGVWSVRCAPGYDYRFVFDSQGKMTSAMRLP